MNMIHMLVIITVVTFATNELELGSITNKFKLLDYVELHNLQSPEEQKLNGQRGIIIQATAKENQWEVALDMSYQTFPVHVDNLLMVPDKTEKRKRKANFSNIGLSLKEKKKNDDSVHINQISETKNSEKTLLGILKKDVRPKIIQYFSFRVLSILFHTNKEILQILLDSVADKMHTVVPHELNLIRQRIIHPYLYKYCLLLHSYFHFPSSSSILPNQSTLSSDYMILLYHSKDSPISVFYHWNQHTLYEVNNLGSGNMIYKAPVKTKLPFFFQIEVPKTKVNLSKETLVFRLTQMTNHRDDLKYANSEWYGSDNIKFYFKNTNTTAGNIESVHMLLEYTKSTAQWEIELYWKIVKVGTDDSNQMYSKRYFSCVALTDTPIMLYLKCQ